MHQNVYSKYCKYMLCVKISTGFFYIYNLRRARSIKGAQVVFDTNYIPFRFNSRERAKKLVVMTNEW